MCRSSSEKWRESKGRNTEAAYKGVLQCGMSSGRLGHTHACVQMQGGQEKNMLQLLGALRFQGFKKPLSCSKTAAAIGNLSCLSLAQQHGMQGLLAALCCGSRAFLVGPELWRFKKPLSAKLLDQACSSGAERTRGTVQSPTPALPSSMA